jgi:DNA anti-recombination protein RmuC
MSAIPPILVQIQADVSSLKAGLAQAEAGIKGLNGSVATASTGMGSMISRVKTLGMTMGVVFGAQQVMKFGNDVIQAASNMNESLSKVQVVFGENSKAVEDFAKNAAKNMGLSNQKALEAAGTYGNLFQAFGLARGEATTMSTTLVQLAADLASFNNTSTEDALNALRSGLAGESEPLKRFGVALNEVTLKNKALQMGLIQTTTGVLPPAIKAQATYALVMEQTKSAQGDYARTADGVANKQRTLAAQFEDTKTKIGTGLLPIYQTLLKVLQVGILPAFELLGTFMSNNKEAIAVFTAVLLAGATAWGVYRLAMKVANFEMATFTALAKKNPIGMLVTAVALLAGAFVFAWNKFEGFRQGIVKGIQVILNGFGYFLGAIAKVVGFLAMLKVPGMKEAEKSISGAANSVRIFSNDLDKLANKKISLSMGGGMATKGADFVTPFIADPNAKNNSDKLKAEAKKVQDIYDKMNEAILDSQDKLNEELASKQERDMKITEKYNERKAELEKNHAKAILQITKDYDDKLKQNRIKRDEDEIAARQSAMEKMASIVKQSVDRLRSAFASGTAFSVTDAFKESGSTEGIIAQFTEKLKAAKQLQVNAAALAGMGYSQTFIEEVVKSGPEMGNRLAEALKNADPTKTGQLQDLYKQLQDTSEHGLDELGKTMNAGGKLATDELMQAYKDVSVELTQTLNKINNDYQKANAEALADSTEKLAQAKADFDEALVEAQKDMADSLLESQKNYLKAIDEIAKNTKSKLDDLKKQLAEIAATMVALGAAKSAQLAFAGSPSSIPSYSGTYESPGGITTPFDTGTSIVVNQQNNTNSSPSEIAKSTLDAIKYGMVITSSNNYLSANSANVRENRTSYSTGYRNTGRGD